MKIIKITYLNKKKWRESNKEILSEKRKVYKEENKEKITLKIDCKCGGCYHLKHKGQHAKTEKHQQYLKDNQS